MANSEPKYNSLIIIILAFGLAYLFLGFDYGLNIYDEAIGIYGAERVALGDIPYKDFWTLYAPGNFYLMAALMSVFGWSIISERIITILIIYLCCLLIYVISSKVFGRKKALLPFAIAIVWCGFAPMYGRAIPPALVFSLISALFLFKFFASQHRKWLIYAGAAMAITGVFRHDMGAYLFGTEWQAVFWASLSHDIINNERTKKKIIFGIKNAMFYTLGSAIAALPFAIYFLWQVPIDLLADHMFNIPLTTFRQTRNLPLPNPFAAIGTEGISQKVILFWNGIIFYIPLLIYILIVMFIILRVKRKTLKLNGVRFWQELMLVNLGANFYNQAMVRSDTEHLLPTMLIAAILLVPIIEQVSRRKLRYFVVIFSFLFIISIPAAYKARDLLKSHSATTAAFDFTRAKGIKADSRWVADYQNVLHYLDNHVAADGKIFVGNVYHDRILLNDVMIYYLSERGSATKYHELHPGIATTKKVQREIIEELQSKNVEYIVLVAMEEAAEPNESSKSSGVYLLDEFIRNNFSEVEVYGDYSIWDRMEN